MAVKEAKQRRSGKNGINMRSIKVKIIAYFAAIILLVSLVLSTLAITISRNIVMNEAEKTMMSIASEAVTVTQGRIANLKDVLETIAKMEDITGMNWPIQKRTLSRLVDKTGFLTLAIVPADDGTAYYIDDTTAYLGDREYIQKALEGEIVSPYSI